MKNFFEKITRNQWILIIIFVILLVIAIIMLFANGGKKDEVKEPPKKKINENVAETIKLEGLEISKVALTNEGKQAYYEADIKNTTAETITADGIDIILKNSKGETVDTLLGYISPGVAAGETKRIQATTTSDLSSNVVKKIEYKIHKVIKMEQ